jgi:hypothetical protein
VPLFTYNSLEPARLVGLGGSPFRLWLGLVWTPVFVDVDDEPVELRLATDLAIRWTGSSQPDRRCESGGIAASCHLVVQPPGAVAGSTSARGSGRRSGSSPVGSEPACGRDRADACRWRGGGSRAGHVARLVKSPVKRKACLLPGLSPLDPRLSA